MIVKISEWLDEKAGSHSSKMKWRLITREKELAIQAARAHIE